MSFDKPVNRRRFLQQTVAFSAASYLAVGSTGCGWGSGYYAGAAAGTTDTTTPATPANALVIGDWGWDGSTVPQAAVSAAMSAYSANRKFTPDALFCIGDNFYGYMASVNDPRWQTGFEQMYPVSSFPGPAYGIPGNHDYELTPSGNYKYDVELQYAARGNTRWTMPAQSYSFQLPAKSPLVTVIALDSNVTYPAGPFTLNGEYFMTEAQRQAQLQYLAAELAKPLTTPFRIVLGHHPLYSDGPHGDNPLLISDWDALFRQYKVHAYLAGHDHDLQHLEFAGHPTSFVCTGTGGSDLYSLVSPLPHAGYAAEVYGFVHMEVEEALMTFRYVDQTGTVLHAFSKTPGGIVTVLI